MNSEMRSPKTLVRLRLLVVALNILLVSAVSSFPAGTTETTGSWTEIEVTELPAVFDSGTEVDIMTVTEGNEDAIPETTMWPNIEVKESDKEEVEATTTYVHKDQEEILNELQNIWYYTEGLNDDQNDLKSSLSSLVHMTYARVYEIEPNETLNRLKFLLKKLRSRLLQQVEDSTSVDLVSTTTEISITPHSSVNGLKNNAAVTSSFSTRKKRSYNKFTTIATFENANSDENSLFSDRNDSFYERLAELKRNHSIALKASSKNSTIQKFMQVKEKIPVIVSTAETRETEGEETTHNPFIMESSSSEDLVFVTTIPAEPVKPNQANDRITSGDDNDPMETPPVSSTVDDIVQSIISVLQSPAKYQVPTSTPSNPFKRPYPTVSVHLYQPTKPLYNNENINDINGNSQTTEKGFPDLPSYLSNLVELSSQAMVSNISTVNETTGFFMQNNKNNTMIDDINVLTTTETSMSSSIPPFAEVVAEDVATEILTSPVNMMNQTFERIILAASIFTNLSSASRMVLLFAAAISILSIALGVYSLGPPMVAVGVLGILVPVLVLLLFQSSRLKRKKQDIVEHFSLDDVKKILELIAEAVEKYN